MYIYQARVRDFYSNGLAWRRRVDMNRDDAKRKKNEKLDAECTFEPKSHINVPTADTQVRVVSFLIYIPPPDANPVATLEDNCI